MGLGQAVCGPMAGALPLGGHKNRFIGTSVATHMRFQGWVGCPGHPGRNGAEPPS